jgi:hypothetical protein
VDAGQFFVERLFHEIQPGNRVTENQERRMKFNAGGSSYHDRSFGSC